MIKLRLRNEDVITLVSLLNSSIHKIRQEIIERELEGNPLVGTVKEIIYDNLESDEMLLSYLRSKIEY